jgi:hypothetical protein
LSPSAYRKRGRLGEGSMSINYLQRTRGTVRAASLRAAALAFEAERYAP